MVSPLVAPAAAAAVFAIGWVCTIVYIRVWVPEKPRDDGGRA